MRRLALALCLLAPAWLPAGTFELGASVDKREVELGEPLVLTIRLKAQGRMDFPPQVSIPPLDGFQARGEPRQGQNVSWMNGAVSIENSWTWELVPIKAGAQSIGPFTAAAKDAAVGEVKKVVPAIRVNVKRPKAFAFPTPTPPTGVEAPPEGEELYDILGDLGPPWARLSWILLGFGGVLGSLALMASARPRARPKAAVVRDPGQLALQELEQARELLASGDEPGYAQELARIFRFYMRHRLAAPDAQWTLSECSQKASKLLPLLPSPRRSRGEEGPAATPREEGVERTIARLEALLYGGEPFQARDGEALYQGLRSTIVALERDARWEPLAGLQASLDRVAERAGGSVEPAAAAAPLAELRRLHTEHLEGLIERAEEQVDARVRLLSRRLRMARDQVHTRLTAVLLRRPPATRRRLDLVLLAKAPHEALGMDALVKDLKALYEALEKGEEAAKAKADTEA